MEIRKPREEEYKSIYRMGFYAWSDGKSLEEYIEKCTESKKYKSGTWYVLANENILVSSLIVYESVFKIPKGFCGIGTVATAIEHRNKGFSTHLINGVCENLKAQGFSGVYLHTDIGPAFYERLGFFRASVDSQDCMLRLFSEFKSQENEIPDYF